MPYENLPDWLRLSYLARAANLSEMKLKKERRALRTVGAVAFVSAVAYPIILGITDQLLPSNDLKLDIAKYGLELLLGTGVEESIRRLGKKRKSLRTIRDQNAQIQREFSDFNRQWRNDRF